LADAVSRRVAGQYERSPYPRWTRAVQGAPSQLALTLARFFPPSVIARLEQPFDVLIAGAGTGQQVVQSASVYGPKARVLAIDLSAASLAYARRMTEEYRVGNVEFMVADILDLDRLDRVFNIIECVGVLHHMADPWAGWRKLLGRLAPGGIAYIGLYSAISRANIARLRQMPDHPGAGCSDHDARNWRQDLMQRPEGAPGRELMASRNFYNLNEFRDLVLHESEQHCTLPEIDRFLADHGLRFAGFTLEQRIIDDFRAFTGQTTGPGRLAEWHRFEQAHPSTFDAMYHFWIERMT
jgi:SAM-dependent methyltransferase